MTFREMPQPLLMDEKKELFGLKGVQGWLLEGEPEVLYSLSDGSSKIPGCVVELGTYCGLSTIFLASGSKDMIYSIDTFESSNVEFAPGLKGVDTFDQAMANLERYMVAGNVKLIRGRSEVLGKDWDKPIRLLFHDASHEYGNMMKDFEAWLPKISPGGFLAVHDCRLNFHGVMRALRRGIDPYQYRLVLQDERVSIRVFKKLDIDEKTN